METVESFARAGFQTLEVCDSPGHFDPSDVPAVRELAAGCRAHRIRVLSLHATYSPPVDITVVQRGERQQAVREVVTAADALAALGGTYLVIHAGSDIPPGPFAAPRLEALAESLSRIDDRCRELGIGLLLEEMAPHRFGGRDEDLTRLAALAPRPFDGFCLDVVHSHLAGSLLERLRRFAADLRLIHLADVGGEGASHEHLLPGDGTVPWPQVVRELDAIPTVPCVLEVDGMGVPDREALQMARRSLSRILEPSVV